MIALFNVDWLCGLSRTYRVNYALSATSILREFIVCVKHFLDLGNKVSGRSSYKLCADVVGTGNAQPAADLIEIGGMLLLTKSHDYSSILKGMPRSSSIFLATGCVVFKTRILTSFSSSRSVLSRVVAAKTSLFVSVLSTTL